MPNGVVALIPARGGSKGIPRKAVRELGGIPVIAWTILAAKKSKSIDRVFVTTESSEIAEAARQYGAEILTRPACLAQEDSQTDEVFLFGLRQLRHENDVFPETLVLLQPTSPFRGASDIDGAFELYGGEQTVISCCIDTKFHWALDDDDYVVPIWHNPLDRQSRQDTPDSERMMRENGAIYICNANSFSSVRNCRIPPYTIYLMDELHSVDLDTESDWDWATWLAESGKVKRP